MVPVYIDCNIRAGAEAIHQRLVYPTGIEFFNWPCPYD